MLFDVHVFELAGFEDFTALLALDEFRLFIAADDFHARVLARRLHTCVLRRDGRLRGHKSGWAQEALAQRAEIFAGIGGILERLCHLSSPRLLLRREFISRLVGTHSFFLSRKMRPFIVIDATHSGDGTYRSTDILGEPLPALA